MHARAQSARFLLVCSIHLSHILYINPPSLVSWKLVHYCILAAELGREIREAADQTRRQTTSDRNTHSLLRASLWSLDSAESQWEGRASAFEPELSLSLSLFLIFYLSGSLSHLQSLPTWQTQVSDREQDSGAVQADYFEPEDPRCAEGKLQRQRPRELSPSLPHQTLQERAESTSYDWKPQFDSVHSCAWGHEEIKLW